jgi:tetratricopeptide (TPR) repeat protein
MSDTHRSEAGQAARNADRESRAEALLVEGLDQYLAGHYEDAIHVWTRVLFLDRNHQRARAYIERARTALGERQRRAEEMLHRAEELVEEGALDQARTLLTSVSQASIDDARVARLWTDIDRAERNRVVASPAPRQELAAGGRGAVLRSTPRLVTIGRFVVGVALGALLVTVLTSPMVRGWFGASRATPAVSSTARRAQVEIPSGANVALTRARTLYARGRLAEALAVLDRVGPSSPERAAVDALRVEIQGVLLATTKTADPVTDRRP